MSELYGIQILLTNKQGLKKQSRDTMVVVEYAFNAKHTVPSVIRKILTRATKPMSLKPMAMKMALHLPQLET